MLGSFLTIMGMTLIMMADLHHLMLRAVADSYVLFPAAQAPPVDDFAVMAANAVAQSFLIGIQISAPFIAYALILYIGMGLVNRLMPQMQVFFIVMPIHIILALVFFGLTLGAIALWFLEHFEAGTMIFLAGG